ncbi:hypothetical protein FO519_003235 [Halicephalobus sp. NKZ332]|nr:hypothetical protein FO519_003235 [Halicephalobus sp. NKZ332]
MSSLLADLVDEISHNHKTDQWRILMKFMFSGKELMETVYEIFSNVRVVMLADDHINFWFYDVPSGVIRMTKLIPISLVKHSIYHTERLSIHFANPGTIADKLLEIAAYGNNFKIIKFVEPDIFVCDRQKFFNVVKRALSKIEFDGDWRICNCIGRPIHVARIHFDKPMLEISRFLAKQDMEINELHLSSNGMTDTYRLGEVNKVFYKVNPRDDVRKLVFHISPTKFWPNFEPEGLLDEIAKIFRQLKYLKLEIESDIPYFMIQKYATMFLSFNRCLKRDDFQFAIEMSIRMRTQVPEPQYSVDVLRELLSFLVVDNLKLKETEDDIQACYRVDNGKMTVKSLEFLLVFDHMEP